MKGTLQVVGSIPVILILAWVIVAGSSATAPAASTTAKAGKGKALFETNCASCHGANGAGGVKMGSANSADLRAPGLEKTYHKKNALLRRAILDGKDEKGGSLDTAMPRWRGKLSVQEVDAIIAFLETLHK